MPRREYARLRVDVWEDDDFRGLDPLAQWLYLHLLTHPSLSFCGVVDWRPKRIAIASPALTPADVEAAMLDLVDARFVVLDADTEEALIRSFVRHDGLLASPNVTTALVREFRGIASRFLRGVVVHELRRAHDEQPELKGWPKARELLGRPSINPYDDPSPKGSGNPSDNGSADVVKPFDEGVPHSVAPAPAVDSVTPVADGTPPPPSTSSSGGTHGRARERAREEPPPRCPRHLDQPADGPCGPCGDARRAHEAWTARDRQRRLDAGTVVGVDCPEHPGQPAGRCGPCDARAVPMPAELRRHRERPRRAS